MELVCDCHRYKSKFRGGLPVKAPGHDSDGSHSQCGARQLAIAFDCRKYLEMAGMNGMDVWIVATINQLPRFSAAIAQRDQVAAPAKEISSVLNV